MKHQDPICGRFVDDGAPFRHVDTRNNRVFYFCSPACMVKFDAESTFYTAKRLDHEQRKQYTKTKK